jgi:hypothetical protein
MAAALLLFGGAVLLLAALVVAWPLLFQPLEPYAAPGAASTPFSERDALLEALSELEREYHAGKLSEDDFRAAKARYEREYVRATKG